MQQSKKSKQKGGLSNSNISSFKKMDLPNFIRRPIEKERNQKKKIIKNKKKITDPNTLDLFKSFSQNIIEYYGKISLQQIKKTNNYQLQVNQTKKIHNLNNNQQKQVLNVLRYFLCQYQHVNMFKEDYMSYQIWEKEQIKKNIKNLSVGMFALVLPNPDNPPITFIQQYKSEIQKQKKKHKPENEQKPKFDLKRISLKQAIDIYSTLFSIQLQQNKNLAEKQYIAFHIAYYLLNFEEYKDKKRRDQFQIQVQQSSLNSENQKKSQQNIKSQQKKKILESQKNFMQNQEVEIKKQKKKDEIKRKTVLQIKQEKRLEQQKQQNYHQRCLQLSHIIRYRLIVQDLNFQMFQQERKRQGNIIKQLQQQIKQQQFIKMLNDLYNNSDDLTNRTEMQDSFIDLKKDMLKLIYKMIIDDHGINIQTLRKKNKSQQQLNMLMANFRKLCKYVESIADLIFILKQFISLIINIVIAQSIQYQQMQKQEQKNNPNQIKLTRLLCKGQLLKQKTMDSENKIWFRNYKRPKDVMTLVRNIIVYKMSKRSNLFVRQFLSKNQQEIYIVIDCNQKIFQKYSQNSNQILQVQLGAIDIFSYEPVDAYYRPLRLNEYIKDQTFKDKYNIKLDQIDTKKKYELSNSIENEVVSSYKKAMQLNEDELRVKIINHSAHLNHVYKQITKKLKIKYIDSEQVLKNQYNQQNILKQQWEIYYVYVIYILQYHYRIQDFLKKYKNHPKVLAQFSQNLGLIYRLAFSKAIYNSNILFQQHNPSYFRALKNIFQNTTPLQNIWDRIGINEPTCFTEYISKNKYAGLWRKYQINQKKQRSKFVSSQRILMLSKIIANLINIGPGIHRKLILSFFPSHDPYILKGIVIIPYFKPFQDQNIIKNDIFTSESKLKDLLQQFSCQKNNHDFSDQSIQDKLECDIWTPSKYHQISIQVIKSYAGQKIALYFKFVKYVTQKSKSILLLAFIVQCLFWAQNTAILATGISSLTELNNYVIFLFSLFNIGWMTNLVQNWKHEQRQFQLKYGLSNLSQEQQKRNQFKGSFKRNIEDDNMNFQYTPKSTKIIKLLYSVLINFVFLALVITTVIMLFVLKSYLIESGYSQTISNSIPSLLVSLSTQVYNFVYSFVSNKLNNFENHKTVSQYESSLIFKNYLINFFNTFNSLFLIAFFSSLFTSVKLCKTDTKIGVPVDNCSYQVYNQMFSMVGVSFATELITSLLPIIKFYFLQTINKSKFVLKKSYNKNLYQAIDAFYQQQSKLEPYMYNSQMDNTSVKYLSFIIQLTSIALFGPSLPIGYCVLYFHGVMVLHTNKYQILYFSQRPLPIKTKTIGIWLNIIQIVSFLGIIVNLCYAIFTRDLANHQSAKIFFSFTLLLIFFRFYLSILYSETNKSQIIMNKRNTHNMNKAFIGVKKYNKNYVEQQVNTDIQNVDYDNLNRKLPEIQKLYVN